MSSSLAMQAKSRNENGAPRIIAASLSFSPTYAAKFRSSSGEPTCAPLAEIPSKKGRPLLAGCGHWPIRKSKSSIVSKREPEPAAVGEPDTDGCRAASATRGRIEKVPESEGTDARLG